MNSAHIHGGCFDDKALFAMGAAFDHACCSLRHLAGVEEVRQLLAKRVIGAAGNGELDPMRLHAQAIMGFGVADSSVSVVSVGRVAPSPAYAVVAHAA